MRRYISSVYIFARSILPLVLVLPACTNGPAAERRDNPYAHMYPARPHTDHSALIEGPINTGQEATRKCLKCHRDAAREVMATSHWTWLGREIAVTGHAEPVRIGKRNLINNYCIGIQSNWPRCTSCHAGYGWTDDSFDFNNEENVDCLVCHDGTGSYQKSPTKAGYPEEGVDLVAVSKSVGSPSRRNCGYCHFRGGGGDAVKHGDLDGTFYFPTEEIDVHMGKYDFNCIDCHVTSKHEMMGRALSVSADESNRLECTSCHASAPHGRQRLDSHVRSVACQTCHIPRMAVGAATKMRWDWSTAGQDLRIDDPHEYLKAKGSFVYAQNIRPDYLWYNHRSFRYLQGDKIDPDKTTYLNYPDGDINDPNAKIWPFKIHTGKQLYDKVYRYLLVPKLVGEGGYWTEFDWDLAARLGSKATGLAYSGQCGFAATAMYWPITHMTARAAAALQCVDCHGENGMLDWKALGYDEDPAYLGTTRRAGETNPEGVESSGS